MRPSAAGAAEADEEWSDEPTNQASPAAGPGTCSGLSDVKTLLGLGRRAAAAAGHDEADRDTGDYQRPIARVASPAVDFASPGGSMLGATLPPEPLSAVAADLQEPVIEEAGPPSFTAQDSIGFRPIARRRATDVGLIVVWVVAILAAGVAAAVFVVL